MDDLQYLPVLVGRRWMLNNQPERVLILGEVDSEDAELLESLHTEVRQLRPDHAGKGLSCGMYAVRRKGRWEVLYVTAGTESIRTSARTGYTDDGDNSHLQVARVVLVEDWEDGKEFQGSRPFSREDLVVLQGTGEIGRVVDVRRTESGYSVSVSVSGDIRLATADSLKRIDGDPNEPGFWVGSRPASAANIGLTLSWTKLRHPLTNTLYSYRTSKTIFRPYQFLPVIKMLNSPTGRLLIADEVGLGKTIEAGLVWSELEQRVHMTRTLVVAPASLTHKWRMEMSRRFDREVEPIKPARLAQLADELMDGRDPHLHGIISIESLRNADEVLERLSKIRPRFDLVIVDEAHILRNSSTKSNLLGAYLSEWADHMLFLSATPINLRSTDLYNLLTRLDDGLFQDEEVFELQLEPNKHLNALAREAAEGAPGRALRRHLDAIDDLEMGDMVTMRPDFGRLRDLTDTDEPLSHEARAELKRLVGELNTIGSVLSRTRKVDVPDAKAVREPHQVRVHWTEAELQAYRAVMEQVLEQARERGVPPGFAMQMPLRQAASCLPAFERKLGLSSPPLTFDIEELADLDDDGGMSAPELGALYGALRDTVPATRHDSKFDALLGKLLQLRGQGIRQVMIFSTFRGTISYLCERLAPEFRVRVLHGGIAMGDRQPVIDAFRDGEFEILVASEVASEGLDFEFCNVLVNYDLPWNPMRVEQRIGRLDRFGQKHEKILILNMHVPGTIESDILERLYERIGIFENSIGDLEPILQDASFVDISSRLLDPKLTPSQRQRRAEEVATALEKRRADLAHLEEERSALSTMDTLSVEGLSDEGPTGGRYVGAGEIRSLIDWLVRESDAKLVPSEAAGILHLHGSAELSNRVYMHKRVAQTASLALTTLQSRLRNNEPLKVTFDADLASGRDVELLSARHPLVGVAVAELEKDALSLKRYGIVRVPTLGPGSRFGVAVDLVIQKGIRALSELWATSIDLESGAVDRSVGDMLLEALASGSLEDAPDVVPSNMVVWLGRLESAAWARHAAEDAARRAENAATARDRLAAKRASLALKRAKAERRLETVVLRERDERIIRMARGQVRNLTEDMLALEQERSAEPLFSLDRRHVAVVEVVGPAI